MESKLFTPVTIGPLTLRNRTIRSAAFESMCPGNKPSKMLHDYHKSVADGGVGMTTIAYAAVCQSGLSFDRQLWMRPEIIPGLKEITDDIHRSGAAASIQLGHCGNMSHQEDMRCNTYLCIDRLQSLFAHIRARHAQIGITRNGQKLRPGCKFGA